MVCITASGRNLVTSPPYFNTSLTKVDANDVYSGEQVRKIVSMRLEDMLLFISAMAFSYSKSLTYLIPLKTNCAPIDLQQSTVRPS